MITSTDILYEGVRHVCLHVTGEAESSEDESKALKLDISSLLKTPVPYGNPVQTVTDVTLMCASWNTTFNFVRIEWDKSGSDETILLCSGDGYRDFESFGGKHGSGGDGTNDIILTTDGGADGDVYDIFLKFKLEF